jgi:hypothetical protein
MAGAALMAAEETVEVAHGPGKPWVAMPVRTLAMLPPVAVDPGPGRFGGSLVRAGEPEGFFRTARQDGRWWLVDPDGFRFIHRGVTSVRPVASPGAAKAFQERFGDTAGWAAATRRLLKDHGFNGLGAWSDVETLRPAQHGMVHTINWNFMASYGKRRGGTYQKPGHTGYPGDCPFIFDPEFPAFCDEHARQLAATRDDPWLLGHFTDNELPWSLKMLSNCLALPESDPGHQAAKRWLRRRRGRDVGTKPRLTPDEETGFLSFAADTYFAAVCKAIRRHDPNHLILGARFHGGALRQSGLFRAAGRHIDVVSVNYYHAWQPDQSRLAGWAAASGKPVMITEWYAKAADSKLANTGGAGWLVKDQAARAAFYQTFVLGLLESRVCVGWHWFRYADNDPEERGAVASNLDSNKGIVTNRYEPYHELLDAMSELNHRTFGLIHHFDRGLPRPAEDRKGNPGLQKPTERAAGP